MRLLRIRHVKWDVVAVLDSQNCCVLSQLLVESAPDKEKKTKDERMAEQMLALLRDSVPSEGPRKGTPFSKPLADKIFEFRIGYGGANKGPKLRVTYFYGKGDKIIICAQRLWKRGENMRSAISTAKAMRRQYLDDFAREDIQVYTLPRHKEPS